MKRNRFRLATVLRVRHVQETVELGRLALARADARRASDVADASLGRYRMRADEQPVARDTAAFLADRLHCERLAESVVVARVGMDTARGVVAERHSDWSIAAQRVSALGRLRDKHDEAFAAATLLEEVVDADERTTARRLFVSPPDTSAETQ